MSKEVYVSFETAKHLKEKEFDWKVFHFYDENGTFRHREGDCYSLYNWNYPTKDKYGSHYCSAPTQQMACRWLREVKGTPIVIEVGWRVYNNEPYYYALYARLDDPDKVLPIKGDFADYQDCVEAAIKFILKNVIK